MVIMGSPFFSVMYFNLVFRVSRVFTFPRLLMQKSSLSFLSGWVRKKHIFFSAGGQVLTDKIRGFEKNGVLSPSVSRRRIAESRRFRRKASIFCILADAQFASESVVISKPEDLTRTQSAEQCQKKPSMVCQDLHARRAGIISAVLWYKYEGWISVLCVL